MFYEGNNICTMRRRALPFSVTYCGQWGKQDVNWRLRRRSSELVGGEEDNTLLFLLIM
jgi:hypothetical protein